MLVVAAPWRSLLYRIDTKTYQPIRYRTRENSRKILGTREGKEREGDAENLGESRRDAGVPSSGEPPTRIRTEYTRGFVTFPSHEGEGSSSCVARTETEDQESDFHSSTF